MRPNIQVSADLIKFAKKILKGKLYFLLKHLAKFHKQPFARCSMKNCSEKCQKIYRNLPVPESNIHKISNFTGQNIILAVLLKFGFVEKDYLLSYTIFHKFWLIAELGKNVEKSIGIAEFMKKIKLL